MATLVRTLAATAVIALLVAGCGGDGGGGGASAPPGDDANAAVGETAAPAPTDADLLIWTDALKVDAVRSVAAEFAEANDISVDVQVVAEDLQSSFVTANAAQNGPDVVVGAHDWIGNMVQNGAIDPLPLTAAQLGAYADIAVEAVTYRGQVYGVPYGLESLVLYRNTELAPDDPQTVEEAFAAGKEAVAEGRASSPFNLQVGDVGDAYHLQPLYTSMGGYLFRAGEDGTADPTTLGVGEQGAIAAARRIHELGEAGTGILRRSVSEDNSIAIFTNGQAPFLVSGPWALADVKGSEVDYDVSPIPGFDGEQPATPFTGAQAFYVASEAENTAFAEEFVTAAVNTEDAMQTMYEQAQLPPAMTSVQDRVAESDPDFEAFVRATERGSPMPAIPEMQAVFEPLGQGYAAIVGGADPERTMRQVESTIADAIETQ